MVPRIAGALKSTMRVCFPSRFRDEPKPINVPIAAPAIAKLSRPRFWPIAFAKRTTNRGNTGTICRPDHHHPCIVSAIQVATAQPVKHKLVTSANVRRLRIIRRVIGIKVNRGPRCNSKSVVNY